MPVNTRELIDAVSIIAENQNIRVTVASSCKASAIVAGATLAGSVVSNLKILLDLVHQSVCINRFLDLWES